MPLRWKRRQIGELVCDRDTPFTKDDRALLEAIAHHAAVALEHGRAVMRGVLAQEIHHRVKNNLQTVASLLRLQARAEGVDPRKALGDSVNRILAIAAVHEVLTEHREDEVELDELIERLRAMLVQGLVAGKDVTAELEAVSLAGQRATALALVFSELLGNALEHGGQRSRSRCGAGTATSCSRSADDGAGVARRPTGRASRSCGPSFATSSAARSSCSTMRRSARRGDVSRLAASIWRAAVRRHGQRGSSHARMALRLDRRRGRRSWKTPRPRSRPRSSEHFSYLERLLARGHAGPGRAVGCGPSSASSSSKPRTRARHGPSMEADPAVAKGVQSAELHPFRLALLRG